MIIKFNPWKYLVWLIWVLSAAIFMIPTKEAIETYLLNQHEITYSWLWLPIYIILWRIWEGVQWLRKTYEEMPND